MCGSGSVSLTRPQAAAGGGHDRTARAALTFRAGRPAEPSIPIRHIMHGRGAPPVTADP